MNNLLSKIDQLLRSEHLPENLQRLFCETLHWGLPKGMPQRQLSVGAPVSATLSARPIAQLSGLPVFRVDWPDDRLPGITARRAVQRALKPIHAEHLVCYVTRDQKQAAFVWARRRADDKTELRTLPYEVGSSARTTVEQFAKLAFTLDELGPTGQPLITAVTDKLNAAFSVEVVTKRFYQEIANWYFWAREQVVFPMPKTETNRDAYVSQSLIRLITRLIFCWFVKQMGLIPAELFDQRTLSSLLKNGSQLPNSTDTIFYKAILQNLFFATLNQQIGKRQFRNRNKDPHGRDPHRGITNLYRYEDLFTDQKAFLQLVERIPFLNGGLFECLDQVYRSEEHRPDVRIDGFSDHPKNPLSVPDYLFFGDERTVDLSNAYGQAKYKRATVRGLIHIFNRYNFTVTESTPLDQEVALDPEMAGKIFENLLAAYNPETATTARKATGSYYTPREIVDYMVDESLIAYLATKLNNTDKDDTEKKLRQLLTYNDEPHQFSPAEVQTLIAAIDNLKALDPAVGSGAFPMGLLHKLVHILGKLDPRNEQWKERQIARVRDAMRAAEKIEDATIRERTLKDLEHQIASIEDAFARGELDYGRKLYLIENCIYGVDIQPIAVQIAKMRFFISLTVDQKVEQTILSANQSSTSNPACVDRQERQTGLSALPWNLGILPLPNLETKFVAANTLIGIERPPQAMLRNPQIDAKEAELRQIRERHFTARTPATKAKYRELDAKLRAEISQLLRADGFPRETTEKLANWNPYDQNASADFFDPEWMFGIRNGFDIVIGNPPYLNVELVSSDQKTYFAEHYRTFYKRYDVFGLFYEAALTRHTTPGGAVAFIVPQQIANNLSYKKLRDLILENRWLREVLYLGDKIFQAANNDVCVLFLTKGGNDSIRLVHALDFDQRTTTVVPADHFQRYSNVISFSGDAGGETIFAKVFSADRWRIKDRFSVFQGIVTGNNEAFLPTAEQIREAKIEKALLHPVLLGRDFEKWTIRRTDRRIIYVDGDTDITKYPNAERWLQTFRSELKKRRECVRGVIPWFSLQWPRVKSELDRVPKILVQRTRNPRLATRIVATIDEEGVYGMESIIFIIPGSTDAPIYYLLAVLNSKLINHLYATKFLNVAIKAEYLKDTPIPNASKHDQEILSDLARRILAFKRADPAADVSALEREIDQHVYRLYGLTPEEIKIVEEGTK